MARASNQTKYDFGPGKTIRLYRPKCKITFTTHMHGGLLTVKGKCATPGCEAKHFLGGEREDGEPKRTFERLHSARKAVRAANTK